MRTNGELADALDALCGTRHLRWAMNAKATIHEAATRLRAQEGERRIEVRVDEVPEHSRDCSCAEARGFYVQTDCGHLDWGRPATLTFHAPKEEENGN